MKVKNLVLITMLLMLATSAFSVYGAIPNDAIDKELGVYKTAEGDVSIVLEGSGSDLGAARDAAQRAATSTVKGMIQNPPSGNIGVTGAQKVVNDETNRKVVRIVIPLGDGFKQPVGAKVDESGVSGFLNPGQVQNIIRGVQSLPPPVDSGSSSSSPDDTSTSSTPQPLQLEEKQLEDLKFTDRDTNDLLNSEGVAGSIGGKDGKYFIHDGELYFVEKENLGSGGQRPDNRLFSDRTRATRLEAADLKKDDNKIYTKTDGSLSDTLPGAITPPSTPGTPISQPVVVGEFGNSDVLQDPVNNELFKTTGVPGRGPPDSVDYAGKEGRYFLSKGELYFVPNDDLPSVLTPEKRDQILPDLRQSFTHEGKTYLADSEGNIYTARGTLIRDPGSIRTSSDYLPAVAQAEKAKEGSKYILDAKDIANIGFYSNLAGQKVEVPITIGGTTYLVDSDGNLFLRNNHLQITGDGKEAILAGYENAIAYDNAIFQARAAGVSLLSIDLSPIRSNIVFTGDSKTAGPYSVDAQGNIYNNNNGQKVSPEEFEKILADNPKAVEEAVQKAQKQEENRKQRAASGIVVSGESGADEIDTLLKAGVITHAEAAKRYGAIADEQQKLAEALVNNNPSQDDIRNAPEGSTVIFEGQILKKDKSGNYVSKDGKTEIHESSPVLTGKDKELKTPEAQKAEKEAKEAQAKQEQTEAKVSWAEGIFGEDFGGFLAGKTKATEYFRLGAAFSQRAGRYRGISNTLFPDATQKFVNAQSHEFFDTMTRLTTDSPLPAAICKRDDALRARSPGQSSRTVRTLSNTYQFVGSIQGEKSPVDGGANVPIRCSENLDPEADEDEMYICPEDLYCNDQVFCYSDPNEFTQPALGYYYKLTWGVSAPSDERFTPYVDENNVSVKFNIQLRLQGGTEFLYKRLSDGLATTSHFQLAGGASDGQTIVFYNPKNYQDACILFDPTGSVIDRDDLDDNGGFLSSGLVKEICIGSFRQSTAQAARFASPGRAASSITTQSGDTALNI